MYGALITAVRLLMGTDLFINGLNWWVKLIGPYPSISDFAHHPPPPDFVGAMIQTGILFHIVKATELCTGLALLTNRFVPLMLVVVFPVTVPVFVVDVVMIHHLRGFIMGMGDMLMNTFLILAYLSCYRAMLSPRAAPDALAGIGAGVAERETRRPGSFGWQAARVLKHVLPVWGAVAALFGVVMVSWVGVMMVAYLR